MLGHWTPLGRSPNLVVGVVLLVAVWVVEVALEARRSASRAVDLFRCRRCGQQVRVPSRSVSAGEPPARSARMRTQPWADPPLPATVQFAPETVATSVPIVVSTGPEVEHAGTSAPRPTVGAAVLSRLSTHGRRRFEAPCPRCGSFDTETSPRSDSGGVGFRCQACDHHWRWTQGSPWPDATSGGASAALRRVSVLRPTVTNDK